MPAPGGGSTVTARPISTPATCSMRTSPRRPRPTARSATPRRGWAASGFPGAAEALLGEAAEAVDVFRVVIERQADAQHVVAHVGDGAGIQQLGFPSLSLRVTEGQEARVRLAVQRVQQLRILQRAGVAGGDAVEQLRLQPFDVRGDSLGAEAFVRQHREHRIEAVEAARVEGGAQEPRGVTCVADAARRPIQVVVLCVLAGGGWSWVFAWWRVF